MNNMQTNSKESTEKNKSHLRSLNSKVGGTKRTLNPATDEIDSTDVFSCSHIKYYSETKQSNIQNGVLY